MDGVRASSFVSAILFGVMPFASLLTSLPLPLVVSHEILVFLIAFLHARPLLYASTFFSSHLRVYTSLVSLQREANKGKEEEENSLYETLLTALQNIWVCNDKLLSALIHPLREMVSR